MNKQELLKQADYNFQRGNRELAQKYLVDLLTASPNEEAAWILLAKVVEEKERKIDCYECALRLNPNNNEVKIALLRLKNPDQTFKHKSVTANNNSTAFAIPMMKTLRVVMLLVVIVVGLGTTTYAIALNNPESAVAKFMIAPTATPFAQTITGNIASQTRAQVTLKYPQYAPLMDALIGFAVNNAENGMDGAPERPGAEITPSDVIGKEARTKLEDALPQPGSLSSVVLTEQQVTSWLAMEMKNSPDLPLSDIQVYLRNDTIQIWGMVKGSNDSTSALVIGTVSLNSGTPNMDIQSVQIGQQAIPDLLVSQAETWLNQLLIEKINEQAPGLRIMNINISNGLITISGMR